MIGDEEHLQVIKEVHDALRSRDRMRWCIKRQASTRFIEKLFGGNFRKYSLVVAVATLVVYVIMLCRLAQVLERTIEAV